MTTLKEPAMADESAYTSLPPRTQSDIDALVAFISARVEPLRDRAGFNTEEYKAFQALLDLAVYTKGVAQSQVARGDEPYMPYYTLTVAARHWDDHPDFQSSWSV